jgi:hypothetical protein
MLLDHVRSWAAKYGNPFDDRIISFWEQQCAKVTLDVVHHSVNVDASTTTSLSPLLPKKNLLVSDHAEDVQGCKAPWGTGDRIDFAEMPAVMRHLVNRVQADLDHACGRLRHVYIEYSPSGQYFHKPTATKAFDGHEYVVIPLRSRKSDTVVTFSPSMRSRSTDIQEVLTQSWSSRDLDALVPNGRFLRVYGQARYDYSWSVRPGASSWFGVPSNVVSSRQEEKTTSSSSTTSLSGFSWRTLLFGAPRRGSSPLASTTHQEPVDDAALVVLHFEGPRAQGKKRSLLLHPESLIFGSKPEPSTFERWNDEMPTAKDVWDDWVVLFVAKNYLNILRLS